MNFQSISIAFLYECLKIFGKRASGSVGLVCTSAGKNTWHRGDAQGSLVESIIKCVNKDHDAGIVGSLVGKNNTLCFSVGTYWHCGQDGFSLLSTAQVLLDTQCPWCHHPAAGLLPDAHGGPVPSLGRDYHFSHTPRTRSSSPYPLAPKVFKGKSSFFEA